MAEEVVIKIGADASGVTKSLGDLKHEVESLKSEIESTPIGSKRFNELASQISKSESKVKDLEKSFEGLESVQRAESFLKVGEGIAGAFTAATGAMALFGGESKQVEEALLKVQAALAITQGIKSITEGIQQMGVAFRVLNGIIAANPAVAIFTAIAAAAGVVYYWFDEIKNAAAALGDYLLKAFFPFIDWSDQAAKSIDKVKEAEDNATKKILSDSKKRNDALKQEIELLKKNEQAIKDKYDTEVANAQLAGASQEQINYLRHKENQELRENLKLQAEKLKAQIDNGIATLAQLKHISAAQAREMILQDALFGQMLTNAEKRYQELTQQVFDINESEKAFYKEQQDKARQDLDEWANTLVQVAYKKAEVIGIANAQLVTSEQQVNVDLNALRESQRRERLSNLADEAQIFNERVNMAQGFVDSLSSINNSIGELGVKNAGLQKTLALVQIAVDTAKAISSSIAGAAEAAAAGGPAAPFLLAGYITSMIASVLAAVAGAKNALKSAPAIGGTPSGGGFATLPSIGTPGQNVPNPTQGTYLNKGGIESGQSQNIKVFVTETDISDSQKRSNAIINKATIQ